LTAHTTYDLLVVHTNVISGRTCGTGTERGQATSPPGALPDKRGERAAQEVRL
jgi:hypothetical protein